MNVTTIQNNLRSRYVMKGYSVITWKTTLPTQVAQVSFELHYHDWLKLQKSKEWKAFEKRLYKRQSKYNLRLQRGLQDSQGMA